MIYQPSLFAHINSRYHAFKSEVLKDRHGETAQFSIWASYMDIIQMVLTLIGATKKTTLNCMSALSVCLVPNVFFFANDHNKYAHSVPVQLITHYKFVLYTSQMQRTSRTKMGLVCHNHWFFA